MAFALFYNKTDLTNMMAQAQATVDRIPPGDRDIFNAVWDGGLKNWGTAPLAPPQRQEGDGSDGGVLILVVNGILRRVPVTLEQFAALLERMAETNPAADFLISVADDVRRSGVDNWPV